MRRLIGAALALAWLLWLGQAVLWPGRWERAPDSTVAKIALSHDGLERSYHVRDGSRSEGAAMIVALHGAGPGAGDAYARLTRWVGIADREGIIAVFPDGIGGIWNDGRADATGGPDDVGFLLAVVADAVARFGADPEEVYLEGTSNGGMMALRLACEAPEHWAGIATVIASMPVELAVRCAPGGAVPMLVIAGTDDPVIPYGGGPVVADRLRPGAVIGVEDMLTVWGKVNGCDGSAAPVAGPNRPIRDQSRVEIIDGRACEGAPLRLMRIVGGGHARPGAYAPHHPRAMGAMNRDMDASEEIWSFFSRQSR